MVGDGARKVGRGKTMKDHVVEISYLFIQQIFIEHYARLCGYCGE